MAVPVIRGRVTPPPVMGGLQPRPRLAGLLARLFDLHPVVRIFATAGAGKTTAVRQAAERTGRPLAWLSVDATDAATGRLLIYLEAALAAAVPDVAGVAFRALSAQLPHTEVAGLLAEAIADRPVLVVLDDVERLAGAEAAVAVLGAFARRLPPAARVVLVGRSELRLDLGEAAGGPVVGESNLSFTVDEVRDVLSAAGRADEDAATVAEVTGGWVAGVVFEVWRSADHVPGMGGEADPLHGYLASQILSQLDSDERQFLITTSVLDHVTAAGASALGVSDPAGVLDRLRRRHLPANWDAGGEAVRYHPRFREYLLERLSRGDPADVGTVHRRHGALLLAGGHYEDAVTSFLEAGALEEALCAAEDCLESVVERVDLDLAERWLHRLAPVRHVRRQLAAAEIMLAMARGGYRQVVAVADELAAAGDREALARSSSRAGALMSWCYMHAGRQPEARQVYAATRDGSPRDAMEYCLSLIDDEAPGAIPGYSGEVLDALVMRVHYYRGYFGLLSHGSMSPWASRVGGPWRIGGLFATGHTEEAMALLDEARAQPDGADLWLEAVMAPKLLCSLGRREPAWQALRDGRKNVRAAGSVLLQLLNQLAEAELELRLNGDVQATRAAATRVLEHPVGRAYMFIAEEARVWLGLTLLLEGRDSEAVEYLGQVVVNARRADRIFWLPVAGVYLAEALWHLGDEDGADRAVDVARRAAVAQGSNHMLLQALAEFPAVLSRRLDAEPAGESCWHRLGRALGAQRAEVSPTAGASVMLAEFGGVAITVDGAEVRPRIKKSYELLAYLVSRPNRATSKDDLLAALFDGRADESAAAYLRQAIIKLRHVLPDGVALEAAGGHVRLSGDIAVTSDSVRFEELVAGAAALGEHERLAPLQRALGLLEEGDYLPSVDSAWVAARRDHLARRAADARHDAAEAAFTIGRHEEAWSLVSDVLRADPYREASWRLAMRISGALGRPDGVDGSYERCAATLRQIGSEPSPTTRQLLRSLRGR